MICLQSVSKELACVAWRFKLICFVAVPRFLSLLNLCKNRQATQATKEPINLSQGSLPRTRLGLSRLTNLRTAAWEAVLMVDLPFFFVPYYPIDLK